MFIVQIGASPRRIDGVVAWTTEVKHEFKIRFFSKSRVSVTNECLMNDDLLT